MTPGRGQDEVDRTLAGVGYEVGVGDEAPHVCWRLPCGHGDLDGDEDIVGVQSGHDDPARVEGFRPFDRVAERDGRKA